MTMAKNAVTKLHAGGESIAWAKSTFNNRIALGFFTARLFAEPTDSHEPRHRRALAATGRSSSFHRAFGAGSRDSPGGGSHFDGGAAQEWLSGLGQRLGHCGSSGIFRLGNAGEAGAVEHSLWLRLRAMANSLDCVCRAVALQPVLRHGED